MSPPRCRAHRSQVIDRPAASSERRSHPAPPGSGRQWPVVAVPGNHPAVYRHAWFRESAGSAWLGSPPATPPWPRGRVFPQQVGHCGGADPCHAAQNDTITAPAPATTSSSGSSPAARGGLGRHRRPDHHDLDLTSRRLLAGGRYLSRLGPPTAAPPILARDIHRRCSVFGPPKTNWFRVCYRLRANCSTTTDPPAPGPANARRGGRPPIGHRPGQPRPDVPRPIRHPTPRAHAPSPLHRLDLQRPRRHPHTILGPAAPRLLPLIASVTASRPAASSCATSAAEIEGGTPLARTSASPTFPASTLASALPGFGHASDPNRGASDNPSGRRPWWAPARQPAVALPTIRGPRVFSIKVAHHRHLAVIHRSTANGAPKPV